MSAIIATTVTRLDSTTWAVPSASTPDSEHIVEAINGGFTCTCRGFEYRGICRHVNAVKAEQREERATALPPVELGMSLIGFRGGRQ